MATDPAGAGGARGPERARRGWPSSAVAYGVATLALAGAGLFAARLLAWGGGWMVVGGLGAWLVQALSFGAIARALDRGRSALRPWLGGIAARFGGVGVTAVVATDTAAGRELPLAYAATILVLLFVEAGWLARRPWPGGRDENEENRNTQAG